MPVAVIIKESPAVMSTPVSCQELLETFMLSSLTQGVGVGGGGVGVGDGGGSVGGGGGSVGSGGGPSQHILIVCIPTPFP